MNRADMERMVETLRAENTRLNGEVERLTQQHRVLMERDAVHVERLNAFEQGNTPLREALRELVMAKDFRAAVQEERDTVLDGAAAQVAVRERVHEATVRLTRAWSAARKLLAGKPAVTGTTSHNVSLSSQLEPKE